MFYRVSNGGTEIEGGTVLHNQSQTATFNVTEGKHYIVAGWIYYGDNIISTRLDPIGNQSGMSISQQGGLYRIGLFKANSTGSTTISNFRADLAVIEFDN